MSLTDAMLSRELVFNIWYDIPNPSVTAMIADMNSGNARACLLSVLHERSVNPFIPLPPQPTSPLGSYSYTFQIFALIVSGVSIR